MKCSVSFWCLFAAILLLQLSLSEALQQDFLTGISTGIQRGMTTVRDGFTSLMSATPLGGGSLFNGLGSSAGSRNLLGGFGSSGGGRSLIDSFPLIGSCDRIANQGVANCLTNFRPSTIGSKGQCCAWRKYRACINGIKDGQRLAAQADRCPSRSFSRATINRISDSLTGFPVSQCPKNSCKSKSG